jgi:ATP synthase protein I
MVDDPPDEPSGADESSETTPAPSAPFREVDGWAALSYIITGVLFYGAIGWLVDAWLGTRGFVGAGIAVGAAAGVGLVWLRYSKP